MGNFERVSNYVPAESESKPEPLSGNYGKGSATFGPDGATIFTDQGVISGNSAQLSNGLPGILGTATTPAGSPTSVIKDDTMVTVNGMTMRADIAARVGLLKRDTSGRYL